MRLAEVSVAKRVIWIAKRYVLGAAAGLVGICLGVAGCSSSAASPAVSPQITLSGGGSVRLGATQQFVATVTNSSNTAVSYEVNGVVGGAAATGTISTSGLYTPPATIPTAGSVTVTAVTQTSPSVTATPITETILNPAPVVTSSQATETAPAATTYTLDVLGTGFMSTSVVTIAGTTVPTIFVSATELRSSGNITLAAGTTTVAVVVTNPNPGTSNVTATAAVVNVKASVQAAARVLDQATFGPTLTDINHVQTVGVNAYVAEQLALPATIEPAITTPPPTPCATNPGSHVSNRSGG